MWRLEYTSVAEKFIKSLNTKTMERIKSAIETLSTNPDHGKQLVGSLKGLRSLRVGKHRIIYKKEMKELIILVVAIGHRKNIYK